MIVGAGPAGLACALRLTQLIDRHGQAHDKPVLSSDRIFLIEKGHELGAHQLSGAIMDPRGLLELVPDFEKTAPLDSPVTEDAAYFLTAHRAWKLPVTPPALRNHGNYVISLNRLVKWLGRLVEGAGVNIFPDFAGAKLLMQGDRLAGVLTGEKGVNKEGKPKENYAPGYELRSKVTVLAEGPRGSLTKELVNFLRLDGVNPQVYANGIKELWEVPPGRIKAGFVAHTLGWPLDSNFYGGGWIYGMQDNRVSIGFVVALEYHDPLFDQHAAFQKFKTHPFVRSLLEGGRLIRYGAKALPEGGWYSMPRTYVDGGLIIGDAASLLNSQRLKGIHIAIKSGMLAAETIYEGLCAGDTSSKMLSSFPRRLEESWIKKELWPVRNFHQSFRQGFWMGLAHSTAQLVTAGRGLIDPMRIGPGHKEYRKLTQAPPPFKRYSGDNTLTFDPLTDVYYSGTKHEEDQPCHLVLLNPELCATRCREEYGNPCQYFCPAAVFEMVQDRGRWHLKINASNCIHCKTCDIAEPFQNINWVPPEGGGGPNFEGM